MIADILQHSYALNSRMQLKARLMEQRGIYLRLNQKVWLCPICKAPIYPHRRMDLHEALLTRGDVQGNKEWAWLIYSPFNCILRHADTRDCWHTPGVGGDDVFRSCAEQLVQYEGYDKVKEYLTAMVEYYPTVVTFALRRFEGLELR